MKKIILATAAVGLFFTACKKADDNLPTTTNTWKVGANTRTATGVNVTSNTLVATDGTNSITVTFGGTLPTSDDKFKIVGGSPETGEVTISVTEGSLNAYQTTGLDNKEADVSVTSNKVSIKVPDVWAKNLLGTDSLLISADLKQP